MAISNAPAIGTAALRPCFSDIRIQYTGFLGGSSPGSLTPSTVQIVDMKMLSYSDSVRMTKLWGAGSRPLARFGRQTECTGDIEFGLETARAIQAAIVSLGLGGYSDLSFDMAVIYQIKPGDHFICDVLQGTRFKQTGQRNQIGGAALRTTLSLDIEKIIWNQVAYSTVMWPVTG